MHLNIFLNSVAHLYLDINLSHIPTRTSYYTSQSLSQEVELHYFSLSRQPLRKFSRGLQPLMTAVAPPFISVMTPPQFSWWLLKEGLGILTSLIDPMFERYYMLFT